MIDITYQKHSRRKQRAVRLWYKVLADYKSGKPAENIAKTYNRSRSWVYWVLRKLANDEV